VRDSVPKNSDRASRFTWMSVLFFVIWTVIAVGLTLSARDDSKALEQQRALVQEFEHIVPLAGVREVARHSSHKSDQAYVASLLSV
jgi:hypothetical protein